MKRSVSVNLELSNKYKQDGRRLVMIRLSERRKHVRFSTGISVFEENYIPKNIYHKCITESEPVAFYKNKTLKWQKDQTKKRLGHYLFLNPLLLLEEVKVLLVGELMGRELLPDLQSIYNKARKDNDKSTIGACDFLFTYMRKFMPGVEFRYMHLFKGGIEDIERFMLAEVANESIVHEAIRILKSMTFKIEVK